jgi:carbon monoxide dehydrogenase subunit G
MSRRAGAWDKRRRELPSTVVRLDDTIDVPVDLDTAWRFIQDTRAIAGCISGLDPSSVRQESETRFYGSLKHVALGVPSTWALVADIERDERAHTARIHLDGVEPRLNLTLVGDTTLALSGVDGQHARLAYAGELKVEGRLAGAGGPIIDRVIASIIERFLMEVGSAGQGAPRGSWWSRVKAFLRRIF